MSAGCPYRCTGMMPLVRPVTAASTARASRQNWSGSISAKTGVAPVRAGNASSRADRLPRVPHPVLPASRPDLST